MKIFVWKYLDRVSYRYHPEGGLAVVAETVTAARDLAHQDPSIQIPEGADPDYTMDLAGAVDPLVIVFPDAGCC